MTAIHQLIIKNDGIGDLILSSGVIESLVNEFPGASILVTCIQNKEIAEAIGGLDEIIFVSREFQLGAGAMRIDREAAKRLKSLEFDTVISLRRFIRKSTFDIMGQVKGRVKLALWEFPTNVEPAEAMKLSVGWMKADSRHSDPVWEPEYYATKIKEALGQSISFEPSLSFRGSEKSNSGSDVNKAVALIVAGKISRWPDANWVYLARELEKQGVEIKVFGGKESIALKKKIKEVAPQASFFGIDTSIREIATELKGVAVVIGNDTGLTHLAHLCSDTIISILGGGTAGRFLPWRNHSGSLVHVSPMPCFDCDWRCIYVEKKCLTQTDALTVWRYLNARLSGDKWVPGTPKSITLVDAWKRGLGPRPTVSRKINNCI